MTPLEKKEQLIQMFGIYTKRLEKLYDKFYSSLASLGYTDEVLMSDALFNFDGMPEMTAEVNNIFEDFVQKQMLTYQAGITDGIGLAFLHDNTTLQGASVLSDVAVNQVRETAVQTFLRTRLHVPKGLNLSQLVWNYASQAKSEFEVAMSDVIADGLKTGTSAEELGRKVRSYLKNPDMMYRRYHEKVVMSDGTKKDVAIWRRRVIDEDGKVRFVKEPLEAVGRGHYRSARKNAYRLMRSEINMAYHNANHDRWLQEPFVIGQHIWPSDQHPEEDVCDLLKGDYPKDFLFIGWHPACMDTCTPITLKGDERKEYYRRLAAGEDMSNYVSPNAIKDVPQGYKDYVLEHADEIIRADRRGKLPWHFDANREYWEELVGNDTLPKLGMTGSKLGRNATNEAYKYYSEEENAKPVIVEGAQKDNLGQLGRTVGVEITPMSFIDADSGNSNLIKDKSNCQSAVVAHEARIRGLNVTAKEYNASEHNVFDELGNDTTIAWINPRNGRKPQFTLLKDKGNGLQSILDDNTTAVGRYHIGANYEIMAGEEKIQRGHIITAQRFNDGRILYYDPQVNSFVNVQEFLEQATSVEVLKVDKLLFNVDIVSQVLTH